MALAGALLLVVVLLLRPQEFIPALQSFSLLNAVAALAGLGILVELALGKQRAPSTPQLPWLAAFVGWCFLATCRRLGLEGLSVAWEFVGLSAIFMLVVAFAVRTMAGWRALAAALVTVGTLISCTCIHQGQQPAQCIVIDTSSREGERSGEGVPDGRPCDSAFVCEQQSNTRATYACERIGLFGTFTEGWRVRWRGTLGDPNELALLLGAINPLTLALAATTSRRRRLGLMAAAVVVGVTLWCIFLTGSRGGQLVVITVFGVYFVQRYGLRGALIGALFVLPVLVFGGRSGEEAESSSLERVDLLYEGIDMIRAYPWLGVGTGQFIDHAFNGMTAHNSYVLAAAELGLPGSLLWSMLLYTSIKIPWVLARNPPPELESVRPLALALVVAFAGMLVGVFFLSFCYKAVLFIFFGLSGALYGVAKRASPSFELRVSRAEVLRVAAADVAMLAFVLVYSRLKGVHA